MNTTYVEPFDPKAALIQPSNPPFGKETLYEALLESRQRWRDLVTMTADFVFETDSEGRLVFVAPGIVLGWPAEMLLGQAAVLLLVGSSGFDPFHPAYATRDRSMLDKAR